MGRERRRREKEKEREKEREKALQKLFESLETGMNVLELSGASDVIQFLIDNSM